MYNINKIWTNDNWYSVTGFKIYHRVCKKTNMTGATSGTWTALFMQHDNIS